MLKVEKGHHLGLGGLEKGDDAEEEGGIVEPFLDNIGGLELSGHPLLCSLGRLTSSISAGVSGSKGWEAILVDAGMAGLDN